MKPTLRKIPNLQSGDLPSPRRGGGGFPRRGDRMFAHRSPPSNVPIPHTPTPTAARSHYPSSLSSARSLKRSITSEDGFIFQVDGEISAPRGAMSFNKLVPDRYLRWTATMGGPGAIGCGNGNSAEISHRVESGLKLRTFHFLFRRQSHSAGDTAGGLQA